MATLSSPACIEPPRLWPPCCRLSLLARSPVSTRIGAVMTSPGRMAVGNGTRDPPYYRALARRPACTRTRQARWRLPNARNRRSTAVGDMSTDRGRLSRSEHSRSNSRRCEIARGVISKSVMLAPLEPLNVGQIAEPAGQCFHSDELFAVHDAELHPERLDRDPGIPRIGKGCCGEKEVESQDLVRLGLRDPLNRHATLKCHALGGKVEAERSYVLEGSVQILRANEKIDAHRRSWHTVNRQSKCAHQCIVDTGALEGRDDGTHLLEKIEAHDLSIAEERLGE